MPCGGIYNNIYGRPVDTGMCFVCPLPILEGEGLFVEEWDAIIHRTCLGAFLQMEEGEVVMKHKHEVYVPKEFLYEDEHGIFCVDCVDGLHRANELTAPFCAVPGCDCVCVG